MLIQEQRLLYLLTWMLSEEKLRYHCPYRAISDIPSRINVSINLDFTFCLLIDALVGRS